MKTVEEKIEFFKDLMKLLKDQFGNESEIVLHDWAKGYEHSIIAIENNHITGRNIGDCGSNLGLRVINGKESNGLKTNYVTKTKDGKILVSSTLYLKNDEGKYIGALCINTDITNLIKMRDILDSKIPTKNVSQPDFSEEFFATNVSDLLTYLINKGIEMIAKPVNDMTKEDKMNIIRYLDDKGAFLITKSNTKICEILDISKFTLYNYLDKIHETKNNF